MLYVTLQEALLFWWNLTSILQDWGFEINPFNWCVANKTAKRKKITSVWHVDELKISQVENCAFKEMIYQISKQ